MNRAIVAATIGLLLTATLWAAGSGEAGSPSSGDTSGDGDKIVVTLTHAALENDEMGLQREAWLTEHYREIEPNVIIDYEPYRYDPQTFPARFAGGQMEDTYAVFFTEPQKLISGGFAADVTQWVEDLPFVAAYNPAILSVAQDLDGNIYGLPHDAYGLGLMYNRELLAQAGLDPDSPPQTWDELRDYAITIVDELDGVDGFNLRNEGGLGGWMMVTMMYSFGGDAEQFIDGEWRATYNNPAMVEALEYLHTLLHMDGVSTPDITGWGNFPQVQDFAAGKVAMTIAAGDTLKWMVGNMEDFDVGVTGFGRLPDGGANATLGGGTVWLYNPKSDPDVLAEAVKYNVWRDFDMTSFENDIAAQAARGDLIGFPMINIFSGEFGRRRDEIIGRYANAPRENYVDYVTADVEIRAEPPVEAQALYTELGLVYQEVMSRAEPRIQAILDASVAKFQRQVLDRANEHGR